MQICKLVSLLKVCLFIMLALISCQAYSEFYVVSQEPQPGPQALCMHLACNSCDGQVAEYYWLSTPDNQDFDYQSNAYTNLYVNGTEDYIEDDESDFDSDRRTADDVGSELEIN